MISFLVQRFVLALFTLAALSAIAFATIQMPPGDWVDQYMMQLRRRHPQAPEETWQEMEKSRT